MQARPSSSLIPWWSVVLIALIIGAVGWWLFKPDSQRQAPVAAMTDGSAAAAVPAPAQAAPETSAPGAGHLFDAAVSADAAAPALPALGDSDGAAWAALSQAVGDDSALALLLREHLIQRVVVMVDNLTQPRLTRQAMALQPVAGSLQVEDGGSGMVITPANAQRYAPYVQAFTHADVAALVAAYKGFYPLFQQAYGELGLADASFNDRLVQVIDHLLNTPVPTQPVTVEPNGRGRLRFTDPMLESLSVGQKALVRLGPQQEAAVKTQLKAIRTALTRL